MNNTQLIQESTNRYLTNVEKDGQNISEAKNNSTFLREVLLELYDPQSTEFLIEYNDALLVLESSDKMVENMQRVDEAERDLRILVGYFSNYTKELPIMLGAVKNAKTQLERAKAEIEARSKGLMSAVTFREGMDPQELQQMINEVIPEPSPYGPLVWGHRNGAPFFTPAHSGVHGVVHRIAKKIGSWLGGKNVAAAAGKTGLTKAGLGTAGKAMVGGKGVAVSGGLWTWLSGLLTPGGIAALAAAGISMAAVYAFVRWMKTRTKILNKIINFLTAYTNMLKTLHENCDQLATLEKDKLLSACDCSNEIISAVRASLYNVKGGNMFFKVKPAEIAEFMNIERALQQINALTIQKYLDIFGNEKMAMAFSAGEINKLTQARMAIRNLEDEAMNVDTTSNTEVPGAPPVEPPEPTPDTATPEGKFIAWARGVIANQAGTKREELLQSILKGIKDRDITDVSEAQKLVQDIATVVAYSTHGDDNTLRTVTGTLDSYLKPKVGKLFYKNTFYYLFTSSGLDQVGGRTLLPQVENDIGTAFAIMSRWAKIKQQYASDPIGLGTAKEEFVSKLEPFWEVLPAKVPAVANLLKESESQRVNKMILEQTKLNQINNKTFKTLYH